MCQLVETIKVKNNELVNIDFHDERVNYSRKTLFQASDSWDLSKLIALPELDPSVVYRCRFNYSHHVNRIEFLPYEPRPVDRLILVYADEIDYSFKYADRASLEALRKGSSAGPHEDILIIKNEFVTDTSFSNIVFYNGESWVTPDSPLLRGTKRALYISKGIIIESTIRPENLKRFQKARLINAMLDLETGDDIEMRKIF